MNSKTLVLEDDVLITTIKGKFLCDGIVQIYLSYKFLLNLWKTSFFYETIIHANSRTYTIFVDQPIDISP